MANLVDLKKVLELPQTLTANTIYFVPGERSGMLDIYVSDDSGDVAYRTTSTSDITDIYSTAETAPAISGNELLWWDPTTGSLMVKYNDGTSTNWIEATPAIAIPAFAGNGTAETMSRSDHFHSSVEMVACEW